MVLGLLLLILVLWLLIRSSTVQTWIANSLLYKVEDQLGADIRIGKVKVRWPSHLQLNDLLVWDQLGDTLLFVPETSARFVDAKLRSSSFSLGKVTLTNPFVYLQEDPGGGLNLSFLLANLSSDTTVKEPFDLLIKELVMENGRFKYHSFQAVPDPDQFSIDYLSVDSMNLLVNDLQYAKGRISANVKHFQGKEFGGFQVSEVQGEFLYEDKKLTATSVVLSTPYSQLIIPQLDFSLNPDLEIPFYERLDVEALLDKDSYVAEADLAHFISVKTGQQTVSLSGNLRLERGSANWTQARLYYPDVVTFRGELAAEGFESWSDLLLDIRMDTLLYNPLKHNQSLLSILIDPDTLVLPVDYKQVGSLGFEGSFKGYLHSFITRGSFRSGVGLLSGEITTRRPPGSDEVILDGTVQGKVDNTTGWLTDPNLFGWIEFDGQIKGSLESKDKHSIDLKMNVSKADINQYVFENIRLQGNAIDKRIEGVLLVDDPNLDMSLDLVADLSNSLPVFDMELDIASANLNKLHINQIDSVESLSLSMYGSFRGDNMDNVEGQIWVTNSTYTNSRGTLPIQSVNLKIGPELGKRQIILLSDYIDARLLGDIHLDHLIPQIVYSARHFLPLRTPSESPDPLKQNNFTFNINLKNPRPLSEKISPDLVFRENTSFSGFLRDGGNVLDIQGILPQVLFQNKLFTDLTFRVTANKDSVLVTSNISRLQLSSQVDFRNINLVADLVPDHANVNLNWHHTDSVENSGSFNPSIRFSPGYGKLPRMTIHVPETELVVMDSVWKLNDFNFVLDHSYMRFDSLHLQHKDEFLDVHGSISDLPFDTLNVSFNRLNLAHMETFGEQSSRFRLKGIITGKTKVFDLHRKGLFLANLTIEDFTVNDELLGETNIISSRQSASDNIYMEVSTRRGDISTLDLSGFFNPVTDQIDFNLSLDKLRLNVFNAILDPVLTDLRGIATGQVTLSGSRSDPIFYGQILFQKAGFNVDYLNTRYTFTHHVIIDPQGFWIENLVARDKFGNEAIVNGGVKHDNFKNIELDFKADVTKFLCLDTQEGRSDGYWGTAFATGTLYLAGPLDNIRLDVNATTEQGTDFSIPVSEGGTVRKIDFISYVEKEKEEDPEDLSVFVENKKRDEYQVDLSGIELNFNINVTPNARAQIIINSETGDVIRAYGRGNLSIVVDTRGEFSLNGEYVISQGNYQFTLQNMPLKRFEIEPGGRVLFKGAISDAEIDVDANYSTNAALYDLLLDESNPDLRQRTPVECHLLMAGRLQNPGLKFTISLPPNSDDIARSQLANLSQEEINKQVLSLLILNQFSPLPGLSSSNPRSYENAGIATTTEMLSNQLNYLLSQITSDFDIGFNYLPGDELTSDEVAVAMRAQLLENRMIITVNGNVDVRSADTDANQLVGDVEVEYKINPSGKLRVKAFTRANDRLLYEYSQYTQGFGIFFREEFDTFGKLFRKYWDGIFDR